MFAPSPIDLSDSRNASRETRFSSRSFEPQTRDALFCMRHVPQTAPRRASETRKRASHRETRRRRLLTAFIPKPETETRRRRAGDAISPKTTMRTTANVKNAPRETRDSRRAPPETRTSRDARLGITKAPPVGRTYSQLLINSSVGEIDTPPGGVLISSIDELFASYYYARP